MPESFQRAVSTDLVSEVSDDGRTVTVRLVPWDRPHPVADRAGRQQYIETFVRGGLQVDLDRVLVEREHDGPIVGLLTSVEDRPDGLYGTIRMSRSAVGSDTLADIEARILRAVSVDFLDDPLPPGTQNVIRSSAQLRRVAFVMEPALDAPVLSVRSVPEAQNQESSTMTTEQVTPVDETVEETVEETVAPIVEQRSAPRPSPSRVAHRSTPTPAPRFESLGHFVRSAALGDVSGSELETYQRALADILTTDAAGMMQEQWIAEVIDLGRTYTPTVNAWRSRPLPSSGMSISQPVVTTRPSAAVQATQKTEVSSTTPVIGTAQWDIATYAGGNDVSIQLILRAEPDYLTELMRLYTRELSQSVNQAALYALNAAAAVGVSGNTALEYTTAGAFDELVIDASAAFMHSTSLRRPADQMAISVDLWAALGSAKDLDGRPLYPGINPMNSNGTFSATGTTGSVVQIPWYVEPELGDGISGVIGVAEAFVTALGPVGTMTADVPAKLGRDVAMYQEAAFGASDASGLVQIVNVTP
jgi:HK97 family phage major capsid protein